MPTRRQAIIGAVALGAMATKAARAVTLTTLPHIDTPPGTVDCHVHILDPARFPFQPKRQYTPGPATVDDMRAMHAVLGVRRVVVVQNSVYGTDNRCLLEALADLGPDARGVAGVDENTSASEYRRLDAAGVRGIRVNLATAKTTDQSQAIKALEIARRMPPGWHLHINAALSVIADLHKEIAAFPATVVLDHFARAPAEKGPKQPGIDSVVALIRSGKAVVKLSGPYNISKVPGYGDAAAIAKLYVEAAPGQVIWGTNWPHTGAGERPAVPDLKTIEAFRAEDDGKNFDLLGAWVPDKKTRHRILVETPSKLYGFARV